MDILNRNRLEDVKEHGFSYDVSQYISEGFEEVKRYVGEYVIYTVVLVAVLIVLGGVDEAFTKFIREFEISSKSVLIFLELSSQAISQLVVPPFFAGYLYAAHKSTTQNELELSDFFKGFDYYKELVIQGLIILGMTFAAFIPFVITFYLIQGADAYAIRDFGQTEVLILTLIGGIGFILYAYITISYMFASAFIIFGDMKALEAMEASRSVVANNFWELLGFGILLIIVLFVGLLFCFIGALFTLPVMYIAIYFAFRHVMGINNNASREDRDDLFDHLIN